MAKDWIFYPWDQEQGKDIGSRHSYSILYWCSKSRAGGGEGIHIGKEETKLSIHRLHDYLHKNIPKNLWKKLLELQVHLIKSQDTKSVYKN